MTKAELIEEVSQAIGETKKAVGKVIDALFITIKAADTVTMVGFGTFKKTHRAARVGRNPQTGEPVQIAAKTVLTFKTSKK